MNDVRPFAARLVRPQSAERTVSAMSDSQDESGVDLFGVKVDPAAYVESPDAFYVYRQSRDDVSYTSIVCDVAVQAIAEGRVRGHEDVDQLRVDALLWHHGRSDAPPALVMLMHRAGPAFARAIEAAERTEPILEFVGPRGFGQAVWRVAEGVPTQALADELGSTQLYIADGHHRSAAALEEWRLAGKPPGAGLLCVVHALDGLSLSAFHRRVSGPVGVAGLLDLAGVAFEVRQAVEAPVPSPGSLGLYVGHTWYDLRLRSARPPGVAGLDAAMLQSHVLDRVDPAPPGRVRTFETVPSTEPLDELVSRCDADRGALFTLAPPPAESLTDVADAGQVMPAKTTYFEPKPAAGIFLRP